MIELSKYLPLFVAYAASSCTIYIMFKEMMFKLNDDKILIFKVFFITIIIPYILFLLLSKIFPILYNPLHSVFAIGTLSFVIVNVFLNIIKQNNEQKK